MSERRWRPVDVRESGTTNAYDGPFEGVPEWLFIPLWDWVNARMPNLWTGRGYDPGSVRFYRTMAATLRTRFDGSDVSGGTLNDGLYGYVQDDPNRLLAVADYLLHLFDARNRDDAARALMLNEALSAG